MGASTTPPPQQPPWNPHWYGNLAQWIAPGITLLIGIVMVFLQVHYRNVDSSAKKSDEHVNTLIDAKLNPALQTINDNLDRKLGLISGQLTDLANRVGKLEGRFEQLDSEQKKLTKLQLNKLSAQFAYALKTKKAIDDATIKEIGGTVLAFTDSNDYQISNLAWDAVLQIANYRTTRNRSIASPLISSATTKNPSLAISVKVLNVRELAFGISYDQSKMVPYRDSARYEVLARPMPQTEVGPKFFIATARGAEIQLDGFYLRNVIIHDAQIAYNGGALVMENVYFVNCTFNVTRQPSVQGFARSVIASTPSNFTTRIG